MSSEQRALALAAKDPADPEMRGGKGADPSGTRDGTSRNHSHWRQTGLLTYCNLRIVRQEMNS